MATFTLLLLDREGILVVVSVLLFAAIELSVWAIRENRTGTLNWCHPVPVFVLGYCIVYYQLPFCYLFDFELPYYSDYVLLYPENISYCLLLASLGLSSFFCGEQVYFNKSNRIKIIKKSIIYSNYENINKYLYRIRNVNSVIVLITFILFFLYIRSLGLDSYFGFAYGDLTKVVGAFSTHFGFAYTILLFLLILIELSRIVLLRPKSFLAYILEWDKKVLAVILITLVPFVLSGDRGSYLQPLALVIVPYFILVKPLRFKQAIFFIVVGAFVMVLVSDTRGGQSIGWQEAFYTRIDSVSNPAKWPTMELANSFGTFNIATAYFPEKYSYNYGVNLFYRTASLVPFSSFITDIKNKNKENDYIFSSDLFFTNILTKGTFSSGSGTSSLADVYMDFGPYGIPVVLFVWGLVMAWISQRAVTTFSVVFVFLYAYYTYFGIYVNRSSFFYGWNSFIWVLIIYYFINRLYLLRRLSK
jgi:hypothetical protein